MEAQKGFLQSLFDFSFTTFITSKLIKILYGLCIIGAALLALFLIIGGFARGTGSGLLMLIIGAPLAFFLCVIYCRVFLEVLIVIFRISESAAQVAEQTRKS